MKYIIPLIFYAHIFAVSSYDFTNQNYTLNDVNRFIKSYSNNKMTAEQIYNIYWQCQAWEVNPLSLLAIIEKESSLVSNPAHIGRYKWREHRCCGYGLIHQTWSSEGKFYKYGRFDIQIHSAVKTVKKLHDRFSGAVSILIDEGKNSVMVSGAVDFALYKYTPYSYGKEDFYKIYNRFRKRWGAVNDK